MVKPTALPDASQPSTVKSCLVSQGHPKRKPGYGHRSLKSNCFTHAHTQGFSAVWIHAEISRNATPVHVQGRLWHVLFETLPKAAHHLGILCHQQWTPLQGGTNTIYLHCQHCVGHTPFYPEVQASLSLHYNLAVAQHLHIEIHSIFIINYFPFPPPLYYY